MPLIDFYGDFSRAQQACSACGWTGLGSEMASGESFGDGVEKECPRCRKLWGFVQFSTTVDGDAPEDWRSKVGRVVD